MKSTALSKRRAETAKVLQTAFGPVVELGTTFEVYLTPEGQFTAQLDGRDFTSDSLAQLRKNLRAKLLTKKRAQTRVEVPVTVIAPGGRSVNIVLTGTTKARGYSVGEDVLIQKPERDEIAARLGDRISYYEDVYRPFAPWEHAEQQRLNDAKRAAEKAYEDFLRARKLRNGAGRTVAEAQEAKVPE